jgi:ribonucleoside-diphosphate reductase alpha chain
VPLVLLNQVGQLVVRPRWFVLILITQILLTLFNGKLKKKEKLQPLVTGSKICKKHLENIFSCITSSELDGDAKFSAKSNKLLAKAIREANKDQVPMNYISRCMDLAKQGFSQLTFEVYDTDWNSDAYATVAGQNSNNSIRIPNKFFEKLEKGEEWELNFYEHQVRLLRPSKRKSFGR